VASDRRDPAHLVRPDSLVAFDAERRPPAFSAFARPWIVALDAIEAALKPIFDEFRPDAPVIPIRGRR
jgi:hypothetical protein